MVLSLREKRKFNFLTLALLSIAMVIGVYLVAW